MKNESAVMVDAFQVGFAKFWIYSGEVNQGPGRYIPALWVQIAESGVEQETQFTGKNIETALMKIKLLKSKGDTYENQSNN